MPSSKIKCVDKRLFNICCQDEVFLPDMLSFHSGRRKLTFHCSKIAIKKSFICSKVHKFELNHSQIGYFFSLKNARTKVKCVEESKMRGGKQKDRERKLLYCFQRQN